MDPHPTQALQWKQLFQRAGPGGVSSGGGKGLACGPGRVRRRSRPNTPGDHGDRLIKGDVLAVSQQGYRAEGQVQAALPILRKQQQRTTENADEEQEDSIRS